MMRKAPITGRYQTQANDITNKHADVDTATFIELKPTISKLCKMQYLETEHILLSAPLS